ncbi:MAG: DUF350 domain-containing protein [Planctomycetota bacterium]|nr:DUF350 domain-containing protein [Planctomycetota bacterium]
MNALTRFLTLAADDGSTSGNMTTTLVDHLVGAVVFTVMGLVVFAVAFWLMQKMCPFSVTKEIEEDQNTSLAIIMGSVMIGISIIIAAAIHG